MVTLDTIRRDKRTEIVRLGELHGARDIRVFGSVARGDSHAASDVDFLVDMDQGRSLFDLGFVPGVQDLLGVRVDVVTMGGLRYLRERTSLKRSPSEPNGGEAPIVLSAAHPRLLPTDRPPVANSERSVMYRNPSRLTRSAGTSK